jgi:asparagine synthase (glutamine-hydrolysing)
VHDGPSHAAGNHYWLQAIGEVAARDGARAMLTGQLGNATVSWSGNGLALPELWRGSQRSALQLFLHAEQNPWQALKRQVAKPLVQPTLLKLRRLLAAGRSPWRDYSALHPGIAAELKLDEQMRAAGHDATFAISPWEDLHLRFFRPSFCIGPSLVAEMGFRNSLATLDPTVNVSLTEFLLRVPDAQFRRNGRSSFLLQRAFRGRLPEQVLAGRHKGLQAADLGHRILRELPAMRRCLEKLEALPTAREFLDLPLMRKSLNDLVQCINVETTAKASNTLLRGIGVGLFLRDLAK